MIKRKRRKRLNMENKNNKEIKKGTITIYVTDYPDGRREIKMQVEHLPPDTTYRVLDLAKESMNREGPAPAQLDYLG
jgi:hypothetical protein